jgi:pyruvate/2-oxoglutarate dehydrogenase complex dihydrolipoamide dehydrogenase (E3) component
MQLVPRDSHDEALLAHARPGDWTNPTPSGRYNLVAIGGGTAGLVAAVGAAGLGAKVALVESGLLGGDCLNYGCVPSKALLRSARAAHEMKSAAELGFRGTVSGDWDFRAVIERVRRLRAAISPHDSAQRLKSLGVDVYFGTARFTGPKTLAVDDCPLEFCRAVIATGTRPAEPPVKGLRELGYLTNETVFAIEELPRTLIVIGAGAIGCELAQAFRRLGSEVHLVNDQDRLLPKEDTEVRQLVAARFAAEGIHLHLGWQSLEAQRLGAAKALLIGRASERRQLIADEMLVAVGRRANVESLELAAAGIEVGKRGVVVDDYLRTANRRVYAAGDVCTTVRHTHAAYAMAATVIRNALFFGRRRFSRLVIPRTTFTDPEVAHVGLTAAEAERAGMPIDSYRVEMAEVDRAIVDSRSEGFAVVHTRRGTGKIVGGTIVSAQAGEMIGELTMLIHERKSLDALARVVHCYPTRLEALTRIALAYQRTRLTPRVGKILKTWLAWLR